MRRTDRGLGIGLDNLGLLELRLGKFQEAEEHQRRAFAILEEHGTPFDRATVLNNLAATNAAQGRLCEAEELYRQSLALRERVFGQEHPAVAQTLMGYAAVLRRLQRAGEADVLEERARASSVRGR